MNRRESRRSRVPIPFLFAFLAGAAFLGCGGGGGGTDAGGPVGTVAAPTLNPSPGTYTNAPFVTISTTTAGASIRYTTDGSTPTSTTGSEYTGPFRVDRSVTVKAIARHSGWKDSPISSAGYTIVGTSGPADVYSYSAANPNGPVETIGGKPVIRLFGTTWCPHAAYIGPVFDRVAREYAAAGKIVAFHWQLDTEDDVLTSQVEAAAPVLEWAMFYEFSPNGSVPTIVIGGKYGRVGNACEGWTEGLLWEEEDLRAAIDEVIRETSLLAPSVATLSATSVTATGAVMNGSVNPNGRETTVWFEWGTDPALSAPAATSAQSVGSGIAGIPVSQSIGGLADNTAYYYRLAAQNAGGISRGEIDRFVTNPDDNLGLMYDEILATILRGALIDNQAGSALSIPPGYYRVQEFRNFADTSKACVVIGISRQYSVSLSGSSIPREGEEWVFSMWDFSSYTSIGRSAHVRDPYGHVFAFSILFGQPYFTVASATIDGVPISLSTQTYTTCVLNTSGWSGEPPWSLPVN